jgi:hypothetical protein
MLMILFYFSSKLAKSIQQLISMIFDIEQVSVLSPTFCLFSLMLQSNKLEYMSGLYVQVSLMVLGKQGINKKIRGTCE